MKLRSLPSLGRTQKNILLWLDAGIANVPGASKNLWPTLGVVTDEEGHSLENEDDSGGRLCEFW